jgi:zinc protease
MRRSIRGSIANVLVVGLVGSGVLSGCSKTSWNRDDQPGPTAALKASLFTLPNGMRVVVHEDHRVPTIKVITKVGVGSADEPPGRGGFAHLFEHLMFMGTQAAPNFDVVMEQVGGSNNAYTDFDETVYYETGPANSLDTFLWLEADRFANLATYMTDAKVDLQRDVVLNEMRQSVLDEPGGGAAEASNTGLFAKGHPYYRPVIGSIPDLKSARKADVVDFFARYYRPSNLTLIVSGDVTESDVRQKVEKLYGKIADRRVVVTPPSEVPRACSKCVVNQTFVDAVGATQVTTNFAWPVTRVDGSFVDPNFEIISLMMNDQFTSSLQQALVRAKENPVATSVSVFYDAKERSNFLTVTAEAAPDVTAATLRNSLDSALATLASTGFSEEEVDGAKTTLRSGMDRQLEESSGRGDIIQEVVTRYGDATHLQAYGHRFRLVTASSTKYAFQQLLKNADRVNQVIEPGDRGDYPKVLTESSGKPNGKALTASAPLTFPTPKQGPAKKVVVPKPSASVLGSGSGNASGSGVKFNFFDRPDAPNVELIVMVAGGGQRDPKGKEGRGDLLATLMTRGAGKRTAAAFTQELTRLGASINVSGSSRRYQVSMSSPPQHIEAVMALLGDVLRRPTFDEKELELAQSEVLAGIDAAKTDPRTLASYATAHDFFQKDSPVARIASMKSIAAVTVNDLRAEHSAIFQPQNLEIVAGGPIKRQELVRLVERQFMGWKNTGPKVTLLPELVPEPRAEMSTVLVDVPGATQTRLIFTSTAPNVDDPTYNAADSSSFVLGGAFTSRLMQKLREEKGYTYGAAASLSANRTYGVVQAYTSVEQSVTGPAITELLAVLDRFSSGDITDPETATATSGTYASSLGLVSTNSALVGTFAAVRDLGLNWDVVSKQIDAAIALDKAGLNTGAKALIDRKRVTLVIAGDLSKVKPQLKTLKLGAVSTVVVDLDTGTVK